MFPGGVSAGVVNNDCLTCHLVEMVLTQPALRAAWQAEVDKMRSAYKASNPDAPVIVDELAAPPWRSGPSSEPAAK